MKQKKLRNQHPAVLFILAFFMLLSTILILISSGHLDSEDGWLYASVARNVYYRGQIASAPYEYPTLNVHMNTTLGKDGVWRAPGSLGYSLSLVPAVAFSDWLHGLYDSHPPEHFPLENDWSFHLFASFTNAFWGAVAGVFVLLYAIKLRFSLRYSSIIALSTILLTNLLVLTKTSFAHMMFTACLVASFYFIKCATGQTGRRKTLFLVGAAIAYVLVTLSYNVTYYLPLIPLTVYWYILEKPTERRNIRLLVLLGGFIGILFFPHKISGILSALRIGPKILFEGVWGFLFSSGKSVFLYSPLLLLIPLFWHKMKKTFLPEVLSTTLLAGIYLYFIGSASITDHNLPTPIWHGGMAWGPRYLSPLIPFGMLLAAHIVSQLSTFQKRIFVFPLVLASFWIQLVGVSTIYLLQYRDLPYNIFIGQAELTTYEYASFIPRYSPLLSLSKSFVKILHTFPSTIRRGMYQVRFFDGFDIPYWTGAGTFRGFREEGYISLTNPTTDSLIVTMLVYNAPDNPASSSATASIQIKRGDQLLSKTALASQKEELLTFTLPASKEKLSILQLVATYEKPPVTPHVIYIKALNIQNQPVNLASLDYPDVSTLGSADASMPYRYLGKKVKDNWTLWNLRSRIRERTLDFWWVKSMYYWDRPQRQLWGLFVTNTGIGIMCGYYIFKKLKR